MARLTITAAQLIHPRPYGRLPATATEEIRVLVQGDGVSREQRPYVAIMPVGGRPAPHDWKRARWEDPEQAAALPGAGGLVVEVMTGPQSALHPGRGDRRIWVRVDDGPVSAHRPAGHLIFT